jgi:UPF0755 protein
MLDRRSRILLGIVGAILAWSLLGCGTSERESVAVTIPKGASFREAADSLHAHGLVRAPLIFRKYAALRKRDRTIRYGRYIIARGASWNEIITALEQGRGIVHRVVVPEGWAVWDIVPEVAAKLSVPEDSVEAAVRDTALLRRLGVPRGTRTLEGYLFPDTYDFPDGATARQAIELMVQRFERVWRPEWNARAAELKLSRHQVVTLASIVEKEVRRGSERPTVSAVYHNRLRIGQALQADPTVQYALGRRRPGRVLYRDLRVNSPYNTYRRVGLPPGPIASPGAASLEASLYPADVTYRYFVAHPDGHHEFRNTYAEHLKAIEFVRSVARRDSVERRRQALQAAVDSAARAVGVPRATLDSMRAPTRTKTP